MKGHIKALFVGQKAGEGGQSMYTFRATTEAIDRQGEIVTLDGWDFSNFEANPVILDSHNYWGIENIVGRAVPPLRLVEGAWEVDVVFNGTPRGKLAQQLVDEGNLRAVSVGFNSLERTGGYGTKEPMKHLKKELLEVSVVPVPANQEAVRVRGLGDSLEDVCRQLVEAMKAAGLDPCPIEKAGRVLSKKNEEAIRNAVESLSGVLASLGSSEPGEGEGEGDGEKAVSVDVSGLLSFVGK